MMLRRILQLGAVLAVTVPLAAAMAPPAAAAVSCPRVVLIGLHGTGQGPSLTNTKKSPEIAATFKAFAAEVPNLPNDGTDHSYRLQWFSYPTVSGSDLTSPSGLVKAVSTVNTTATQLDNYVSGQVAGCSSTLVSVVGYSMGAWIENVALTQHYYFAAQVNLVAMEGDPCWSRTADGSAGLTQRTQEGGSSLMGCLSDVTYPYLSFANPFTAQSVCLSKDPICGEGYNLVTLAQQFLAAKNCTMLDGCTHFDYVSSGAAAYVGKWLADNAFT